MRARLDGDREHSSPARGVKADQHLQSRPGWNALHDMQRTVGNRAVATMLARPVVQRFAVTDVADVHSLQMESFSDRLDDTWGGVAKKLSRRDSILAARLKLVKSASPAAATIGRLQARWSSLRKLLGASGAAPVSSALPSTLVADLKDEESDRKALTTKADKPAAGEIAEFLKSLNRFVVDRQKLDEEKREFHRFD